MTEVQTNEADWVAEDHESVWQVADHVVASGAVGDEIF